MIKSLLLLSSLLLSANIADAKTRVSVIELKDKSGDSRCRLGIFGSRLGSGFTEQLITALSETGRYELHERAALNKMYQNEHKLINSDSRTLPEANRFKAAQFSITGAITSFELCDSKAGGSADVGKLFGFKNAGLKVGGKMQKARVALDLRVINVKTGQIMKSVRAEGTANGAAIDVKAKLRGADLNSDAYKNSPIGEAGRDAINEAVRKLAKAIPHYRYKRVAKRRRSKRSRRVTSNKPRPVLKAGASSTKLKTACHTNKGYGLEQLIMCKPIKASKSGKRWQVLNLKSAKMQLVSPNILVSLHGLRKSPAAGEKVYVPSKSLRKFLTHDKGFAGCTVIDSVDNTVMALCGSRKKEYQFDKSAAFKATPYSTKRDMASNR